jgi:hypothetical protein
MAFRMDMVCSLARSKAGSTMGNGRWVVCLATEFAFGVTAPSIKDNGKTALKKVKGS